MSTPDGLSQVVVFAGPSWPRSPRIDLPSGWELRPPAQRGDVLAALAAQPHTVVLLDGYYFTVPAVTHKEILYALDAGTRVIGAASLGALRAAELEAFGMTGVGRVFEWYRSGRIDGDDEVALLHAPAEHGYRALTLTLVEVRHAVDALAGAGRLDPADGGRLIAALKSLSFLDRSPARVGEIAREILGEAAAGELAAHLKAGTLKQDDAREALALAATGVPARAPRRRNPVGYLSFYKESYLRCPPGSPGSPSLQAAWRMAQLFHPQAPGFVREVRLRSLLVAAAARGGLRADPDGVEAKAKELRRLHLHHLGRVFLPDPEYREEARFEALAAQARLVFGGVEGALAWLARSMGVSATGATGATGGSGEEEMLRLAAGGPESLPAWWLVRAFCLRPAFREAAELAIAAEEVHGCFLRWADGARVAGDDLTALAAGFWGCEPGQVPAEAARRWLFPSFSLSAGLREALERVAAAERLPRPINGYPERRRALIRTSLSP
ncbi:MAG: TfuA-like protein [Thermoanaerobaculia bacterium]